MKSRAYGKINLSLNVTGIDDKGYHTLESIFLPIDFYDEIEIVKSEKMEYICNRNYIVFNNSNTIVKAINIIKEEFGITDNFKVILNKHLPTQAGLAGGSTDGACVIRMINNMYGLNLNKEKIKELCLKIGSDVLFTYYSRPALVTGTGDNLEFIKLKKNYNILIVKPKSGVSTKECYKKLDETDYSHPNVLKLKEALTNGDDIEGLLGNSLQEAAIKLNDDIAIVKEKLIELGAKNVLMSGSGSSVFAIDEDYNSLKKIYDSLKNTDLFIRITKIKS